MQDENPYASEELDSVDPENAPPRRGTDWVTLAALVFISWLLTGLGFGDNPIQGLVALGVATVLVVATCFSGFNRGRG